VETASTATPARFRSCAGWAASERATRTVGCAQPGCTGIPIHAGRCRAHARWPTGNPRRASGWEISRLKAMLIAERGERCEYRGGDHAGPLELHHVDSDPSNNHPDNLELRCRRHNPRGRPRAV
jgi:HNH endonuclease